jgi:hypothetical protein
MAVRSKSVLGGVILLRQKETGLAGVNEPGVWGTEGGPEDR